MGKARLIAIVGGACAAILTPFVAGWEGKSNDPYADLTGVLTVCYGETRVEMRRYTDAECEEMLANALGDFAQGVLARNPNLKDRPHQLAAATSLAYNIGITAYRGSTAAKRFEAGDFKGACEAIKLWTKAGGKVVKGLVNRREAEYKLCMTGLVVTHEFSTGIPPEQYQADAGVFTFYVADVSKVCGERPGATIYACSGTKNAARIMVLPNPCQYAKDEWFARLACHERGHHLGWPADHPYPVAL